MKRRIVMLVMALALAATTVTGCGKLDGSEVVAEIGDAQITANIANFYARYQEAQYETYYASFMGENMWSGDAEKGVTYEESVKKGVMESLQTLYVLDAHKGDYKIEITEEEQKAIDKAASDFESANALKEKEVINGDKKTVAKVMELLTIQSKMEEAMTADVDTNVSDEEAAQKKMQYVQFSFNKTQEDGTSVALTDEEKAALKTQAETFAAEAPKQKNFKKYAEKQKLEVADATFDAKSETPNADLVKAADALKKGEFTGLIETDNGYYVATLVSTFDKEATEKKKTEIVEKRKQDQFSDMCKKWVKEAKPKVHKGVWKKISFIKQGVTIKQEEQEPYTDDKDKKLEE